MPGEMTSPRETHPPAEAPPEPAPWRFRPDLEGLRGVAVVLILLYHAGVPGFHGGYVGVDVFFVLSGFLISGIIVRELQATGSVSVVSFYARRARRILPAALAAIAVVVVVSTIVLSPVLAAPIAREGSWAALFAANIEFARRAVDYFDRGLAPSPLIHFWSLGVEEQFYLCWPALLLLAGRGRRGSTRRVTVVVMLVGIGSLALGLWVRQTSGTWAFYSLPTRAWELALGAAIALAGSRLRAIPRSVAGLAGAAGLAMILAASMAFGDAARFPGKTELLATLGAAGVIAVSSATPLVLVSRLLATRPLRWLGRISYSLYLWHWPLIVIPAEALGADLGLPVRIGLALTAIPVAAASYRWIEEPFRHGRLMPVRPGRALALAGVATLLVAGASLAVARSTPATAQRPELPRIYADGCGDGSQDGSGSCVYGDPGGATVVVLTGDSKSGQWFPALEVLAERHGWRLVALTRNACPAVAATVWSVSLRRPFPECDQWRGVVLARMAGEHPDLVVASSGRAARLALDGGPDDSAGAEARWEAAQDGWLTQVRSMSGSILLIGDAPRSRLDPPVCLASHPAEACTTPLTEATGGELGRARLDGERRVAVAHGVTFLDPTSLVCPADPCPTVIDGLPVYRDPDHLGPAFVVSLSGRLEALVPASLRPSLDR